MTRRDLSTMTWVFGAGSGSCARSQPSSSRTCCTLSKRPLRLLTAPRPLISRRLRSSFDSLMDVSCLPQRQLRRAGEITLSDQQALAAAWPRPTDVLAMHDDQRVQLIISCDLDDGGQFSLDPAPQLIVIERRSNQAQAREQALGVRINDEDRPREAVEQDRIGSLLADAVHRQQRRAQARGRPLIECLETANRDEPVAQ